MDIFAQLVDRIIKEQEGIIGPLALEQAKQIPGLSIDGSTRAVTLQGDQKQIIDSLVDTYKNLFGPASVEVCKDVARSMLDQLPKDQIPPSLA